MIQLTPGQTLGEGQFLLLTPCGADDSAGMEFWRARDTRLDRDVALTVLVGDPGDPDAGYATRHALGGIRHAVSTAEPGVARILDVLRPGEVGTSARGVFGVIVAEWTPGADLGSVLADGPVTAGDVAHMMRPLVAAVDAAHHAGLAVGADNPARIRIAQGGIATLAFLGPSPDSTSRDDVRGLGALLYVLLTGHWPGSGGRVAPPANIMPGIPRELSLITALSLDRAGVGGIRTCGPLLHVLDEVIDHEGPSEIAELIAADPPPTGTAPMIPPATGPMIPPATGPTTTPDPTPDPTPAPAPEPEPAPTSQDPNGPPARAWFTGRRRLALTTGALTVVAIAIAVWIGTEVAGFFNSTSPPAHGPVAMSGGRPTPTTNAPAHPPTDTTSSPPPASTTTPPPLGPVAPNSLSEYVVSGGQDNPDRLSMVADGNPNTMWKTDQYRQQFPQYEPGIGIMAGFGRPLRVGMVSIDSPSAGTVVQVRGATSPDESLDSTQLLASATLTSGTTTIPVPAGPPTPYVLVWITQLADSGGGYQTTIAEITYLATA